MPVKMIDKKIISLLLLLLILTFSGKAQFSVGVSGGYSNNHLNTDISNRVDTKNTNGGGYNASLLVNYNLSNWISIQSGLSLVQKNYSFVRNGDYQGIFETFTNTYIQLPLTTRVKVLEKGKFKLLFHIGVYEAYWAFAHVNGATPNILNSSNSTNSNGQMVQYSYIDDFSEKYQFNNIKDNRFEFGLTAGISIHYTLNNKFSIFIEPEYYQSLTDQQKKYMINQIPNINQTFCVSMGCIMKLGKDNK
jgi:hypothetical protein